MRIFKFLCKIFNKFFEILQKSLMSKFLLNVSPNPNFGDAIAVLDLSGIHVLNFVCYSFTPPEPKSWRRP